MSVPKSSATTPHQLYYQVASLLLYRTVFANEIGEAFLQLLRVLGTDNHLNTVDCLQAYGNWFQSLAATNQSWQDYLVRQILLDDNPFSQQLQKSAVADLPPSLLAAARHDLQILENIYNCSSQQISQWIKEYTQSVTSVAWDVANSALFLHERDNWQEGIEELATHYRHNGTGIFARYRAFGWQEGQLVGIAHPDPVQLEEIVGYEAQKEALLKNTEFLLAGYPSLHVLLYGTRGSGKSSLVKALLQKYGSAGLRLIEVGKSELQDLPKIVEQLRDVALKFIIFVDDLSFEEDDDAFKALKVVLEGRLTARASNVVVYATSNRRHLVREFFGDRAVRGAVGNRPRPSDSDEIHAWDSQQEKLSFSDRFGLTLTFTGANQDTYLEIVRHLAKIAQIPLPTTELEFRAKQWATRYNGRSGRTARQFIDYLQAELALSHSS